MTFYSGYMAPEYATDGLFSVKSDVFSFGILLLEIVSGKKSKGFYHPDHNLNLIGHVSLTHHNVIFSFQNCSRQVSHFLFQSFRHGSYGKKTTSQD